MKRLMACLSRVQSGFALAESGEMLPGRDKSRILAQFAPRGTITAGLNSPGVNARKQVGLGLGASLPAAVMSYVISACRRMDADLNVLTTNVNTASTLLAPYREQLEAAAIACFMVELDVNHERSLIRYLNSNSRITFVVSGGADDPVQALIGSGKGRRTFETTPVPIVVVTSEAGGALKP